MYILCQLSPQGLRVNIVFLFLVEFLWIPRVISIDRPDQESVTYPFFSLSSGRRGYAQARGIMLPRKNQSMAMIRVKSIYHIFVAENI